MQAGWVCPCCCAAHTRLRTMPTHSGSASHHSTPHFPLLNHHVPRLLGINFLLMFSTKSGHRGSRSPWRWQGRGICTSRSRRRIWKRMLRMYLAAIKDVLRMLLLPSAEVVGSDQEAKSSSTSRGWTWIAKTRCISSCLECWMLNVDVEVAYMSIVALPAPMAAVSRYLCGVKACTKIDLRRLNSVTLTGHLFELLDKQDEVFLVLGRSSPLCWVFPIQIKTYGWLGELACCDI